MGNWNEVEGSTADEWYPECSCPKCGKEQVDMDGFGFIACIPGCGYCTHPSADGEPPVCGICSTPLTPGERNHETHRHPRA